MFWDLTPIGLITTAALAFGLSELTDTYSTVLSQYQPFQQLFSITCFLRDVVRHTHTSWSFHYPKASLALACISARLIGLVSTLSDISSASNYVLNVFGCLAPLPASAVPQVIGGVIQYVGSAFAFLRNLLSWTSPLPSFTVSSNYAMPSYFLVFVKGMDDAWLPELPQAEGWNLLRTFSSGVSVTSKPSDVDVEVARAFLARFDPPKEDYSGFLALVALMFLSVVFAFALLTYKLVNASTKADSVTGFAHDADSATAILEQGHCKRNTSYDPSSSTETFHGTDVSLDTLVHYSGTPGRVLRSLKNVWYGMAAFAPVVGPSTPRIMFVNEEDDGHANVVPGGYPVLLPAIELDNKTLGTTPSPSYKLKETRNPSRGLAALKSVTGSVDATGRLRSPLYKSEETRHPSLGLAASESATLRKKDDVFGDDVFHGQSPTIALESPTSAAVTRMIKMLDAMASSSLTSSLGDAADIGEGPSPRWTPIPTPQRPSSPPKTPATSPFSRRFAGLREAARREPETPRITRSVLRMCRFVVGPLIRVPEELRDEYPGCSPWTPAAAERARTWMANQPRRAPRTPDPMVTDSIRKLHVWALLSPSRSMSQLPSSPSPCPPSSITRLRRYASGKRKYIESDDDTPRLLFGRAGTSRRIFTPSPSRTPAGSPPAIGVLQRRLKDLARKEQTIF